MKNKSVPVFGHLQLYTSHSFLPDCDLHKSVEREARAASANEGERREFTGGSEG